MTDQATERQSYPKPTIIGNVDGLSDRVPIGERIKADYYEQEVAKVFRRSWLLLGHVGDARERNQYFAVDIPTFKASVIVTRDREDRLRGFYNVCRHRGNRLVQTKCGEARGKAGLFICGFHGWSFGTDGRLMGVPEQQMFPDLDKKDYPLVEFPVGDWGGLIFGYFGQGEPHVTLEEWLGELHPGFEGYFSGMERIGGFQAELACNWNIALDAFSEGYHSAFLHRNTVLNFFPPPEKPGQSPIGIMPTIELFERHQRVVTAAVDLPTTLKTEHMLARHGRRLAPYAESDFADLPAGVNPDRVTPWAFDDIKLFPNAAVLAQPNWSATLSVLPDGPERTRFLLNVYSKPARNAGDRLNQAYWRTTVYHTTLEDLSTVESADLALRSGAVNIMPLSLHEIALQKRYQVAAEMVDA